MSEANGCTCGAYRTDREPGTVGLPNGWPFEDFCDWCMNAAARYSAKLGRAAADERDRRIIEAITK